MHPLVRLSLPVAALLLGLTPDAEAQVSAQTAAGSEGYVALAGGIMSGGGSTSSANYQSTSGFGQFTTGLNTAGTSSSAVGGIVGAGASSSLPFLGAPPIVFGFKDGVNTGSKDGGDRRTIIGLNFLGGLGGGAGAADDGATTTVTMGTTTLPPEDVTVTSDNEIDVTTPEGVDASTANPLGRTDVRVTTTDGTGELCGAYVYQPALVDDHTTDDTPLGADLVVTLSTSLTGDGASDTEFSGGGAGGATYFVGLSVGVVQGQITLIPKFEGSLELDAATQIPVLLALAGPGDTTLIAKLSVNDPSLVGIPFQLQAALFTLDGGLAGEFTNTLPITFTL